MSSHCKRCCEKRFCDLVKKCQKSQLNPHFHLSLEEPLEFPIEANKQFTIPLSLLRLNESSEWFVNGEAEELVYSGPASARVFAAGDTSMFGLVFDDTANIRLMAQLLKTDGQVIDTSLQAGISLQNNLFSGASANSLFTVLTGERLRFVGIADRGGVARIETLQLSSSLNQILD